MREGYFAGLRHAPAADKSDGRGGVANVAKRPLGNKRVRAVENARDGMYLRCFNAFFKGHFREYPGNSLGYHAFSRSGRAYQQYVVKSRRSCFNSCFYRVLSAHVRKIGNSREPVGVKFGRTGGDGEGAKPTM